MAVGGLAKGREPQLPITTKKGKHEQFPIVEGGTGGLPFHNRTPPPGKGKPQARNRECAYGREAREKDSPLAGRPAEKKV